MTYQLLSIPASKIITLLWLCNVYGLYKLYILLVLFIFIRLNDIVYKNITAWRATAVEKQVGLN